MTGPASSCGATPASLYHRTCGVLSHGADIWLCPVHGTLAAYGAAICRRCAERGGIVRVRVYRVSLEPIRLPLSSARMAAPGPEVPPGLLGPLAAGETSSGPAPAGSGELGGNRWSQDAR